MPDDAPFSALQRAWLNGFLAGLFGDAPAQSTASPAAEDADYPWHDPALEMPERMELAAGRPLPQRLMAAMAQLDCGQCGICARHTRGPSPRAARPRLPSASPAPSRPTGCSSNCWPRRRRRAPVAAPSGPARPALLPVRVLAADPLTKPGSAKDVRHVVIDLTASGLAYQPGDFIGLATPNDPALVAACIAAAGATRNDGSNVPRRRRASVAGSLHCASRHCAPARPHARSAGDDRGASRSRGAAAPTGGGRGRRGTDGPRSSRPADGVPSSRPTPAALAASLPALRPRLYSIASSLRATPGQVHLCVSVARETRRGRVRHGIASAFLADRAIAHGEVGAYLQPSHFRLPADPSVPVIMCGPGTGIAPFRAFLQERAALGQRGRTWLFFGDQHRETDFLFEPDLTLWLKDGTLARLDTAFSRDQKQKLYVQDRMMENAGDIWRWLQEGGHFYVCGDAMRMARDVDAALRRIVMAEGRMTEAQARDWIVALARQGRYLRDVY